MEDMETDPQDLFDELATGFLNQHGVTMARGWRADSQVLKVNNKIFAMLVRDHLVVKLPAPQAATLTETGQATPFEPRPGRRMREWVVVALPPAGADDTVWRQLMADASSYVGSGSNSK